MWLACQADVIRGISTLIGPITIAVVLQLLILLLEILQHFMNLFQRMLQIALNSLLTILPKIWSVSSHQLKVLLNFIPTQKKESQDFIICPLLLDSPLLLHFPKDQNANEIKAAGVFHRSVFFNTLPNPSEIPEKLKCPFPLRGKVWAWRESFYLGKFSGIVWRFFKIPDK